MRWVMGSVVALLAALAWAPAAGAQVFDDNPAASSRGAGHVIVFIRGAAGDLQYSELSPTGFTPWASLGGNITSGPGAESRQAGTITDVFARATDGTMYQQAWMGGWLGWAGLGGAMLSAPGVDARQGSTGAIDTYYRAPDNRLAARSWTPASGWSAEDFSLGISTLAAPALVSRAPDVLDVFVRGTDDAIYRDAYTAIGWSGWTAVPGDMRTKAAPMATTRTTGTMDLLARGGDGEIQWASFDGAVWSSWRRIVGAVDSSAAAISDQSNRLWLFARQGGDVAFNVYTDGTWSGWQPMHPPPPPPACAATAGKLSGKAKTVGYSKRPLVAGRALTADGKAPLAGATVTVADGKWKRTATASKTGRYRVRVPAGPTRRLKLQALAPGAGALVCSTMRVRTRAGVKLSATKRVRPRGRVKFRGRVLGAKLPRLGKLVELQAFDDGRWLVFASKRTDKKGVFKTSYRLRNTFGPRTFRFRARVRKESGFPYEPTLSKAVRVKVRRKR